MSAHELIQTANALVYKLVHRGISLNTKENNNNISRCGKMKFEIWDHWRCYHSLIDLLFDQYQQIIV